MVVHFLLCQQRRPFVCSKAPAHVVVSTMTVAMAKGVSTRAKSGLLTLRLLGAVFTLQQKTVGSE